jgi:hypothetical protein
MPTFFKVAEALDVAPHVLLQRAAARITDLSSRAELSG